MKPGIVLGIAALALAAGGAWLIYGGEEAAVSPAQNQVQKNVDGLMGQITAQQAGAAPIASGAAPSLPLRMYSFAREGNLKQYADSLKQSQQAAQAYQGLRAIQACLALRAHTENMRIVLEQADGTPGMNRERRAAIEEVQRRCQGFANTPDQDMLKQQEAQMELARRLGSVEAKLDQAGGDAQIDRDTMLALLQSHADSAWERASPAFAASLKNALKISPDTIESQEVDTAVMLAGCELGKDCSEQSWGTVAQCAFDNYCQKPPALNWQDNLSEENKKRILDLKTRITQMVRSNNYSSIR
ncbi:hypothetical protein V8J88_13000 [Massilia sp. W12]|uniref:hypothetical protein n=1 Tax=Massilia sp. W12 TaxID=3126507 RepID=UPI0030D38100